MKTRIVSPNVKTKQGLRFKKYFQQNCRNGDRVRICAILNLSYPTLKKYTSGYEDPLIHSAIIDYFDQRNVVELRSREHVGRRLNEAFESSKDIKESYDHLIPKED